MAAGAVAINEFQVEPFLVLQVPHPGHPQWSDVSDLNWSDLIGPHYRPCN